MTVQLFVILLFLKMLATSTTLGSGAVGGLFAPTLLIGALYGGAFGYGVHSLSPSLVPQPELFVLLGMVVMFGSIVKGYWSGLLMVADLSGCYHQLLLPGVIAGCTLTYAAAITAFITQSLIGGGQMLFMPMYLYQQASTLNNWPFAAAISFIFLIAVLAVITIFNMLGKISQGYANA